MASAAAPVRLKRLSLWIMGSPTVSKDWLLVPPIGSGVGLAVGGKDAYEEFKGDNIGCESGEVS